MKKFIYLFSLVILFTGFNANASVQSQIWGPYPSGCQIEGTLLSFYINVTKSGPPLRGRFNIDMPNNFEDMTVSGYRFTCTQISSRRFQCDSIYDMIDGDSEWITARGRATEPGQHAILVWSSDLYPNGQTVLWGVASKYFGVCPDLQQL